MNENGEFDTHFFCVIYTKNGRMKQWDEPFLTKEAAEKCVKQIDAIAILEWVRDRRPQFDMVWIRDDWKNDKRLTAFKGPN